MFVIAFNIQSQQYNLPSFTRFSVISSPQGLSQSSVFSLAQDNKGFIWIGTRDGLNRFDGYNFKTYRFDPQDTNSISNNEITVIYCDKNGDIWIGTRGGGLNKFLVRSNRFVRFNQLVHENIIRDIYETPDGTLWIGSSDGLLKATGYLGQEHIKFENVTRKAVFYKTDNQLLSLQKKIISVVSISCLSTDTMLVGTESGMFFYLPSVNKFIRFNCEDINAAIVTSILVTKNRIIWVGSFNGLLKIEYNANNSGAHKITTYNIYQSGQRKIFSNRIESLTEDSGGNIWVGTRGGGLVKIDQSGRPTYFLNDKNDIASIRDNIVNSLLIDNTGVLWIGTESQGCNLLDLNGKKFIHIRNIPNNTNSLSDALVTAISGSPENIVWIGSAVKGLDQLIFNDERNYTIRHLRTIPVVPGLVTSEIISLMLDRDGELWIGNATDYLVRYSESKGFKSYLVNGYVFSLLEDSKGRIWYGTWGQGLGWIEKNTHTIHHVQESSNVIRTISSDKVIALYEDHLKNLWIGTKGGGVNILPLHMAESGNYDFITYRHNYKDPKSLSHNDVYCIKQDKQGNVWIGTGSGLNKIEWNHNQPLTDALIKGEVEFKVYLEKDGLSNGVVFGILEDRTGNLWLSTNNGLSMFEQGSGRFINYNVNDGLQANEFYHNAYFQDSGNNMYFGGVNGLTVFNADSIKQTPVNANVIITGLKVFNNVISPGEKINNRIILEDDVFYTNKIVLTYKEKEFTLEFSALQFINPQRMQYEYRLINFNDQWQKTDANSRTATYTNLDDGDYVFQVRAVSKDGFYVSPPAELQISIIPPFWRTSWFFLIYIAAIVGALFLFRSYSLIAVKEKNKLLIERLEHKRLVEMTEAKMRFLTNISHEIRTPLTLINDPLETVINEGIMDENSKKNLKLISKNVQRLLQLVNQLLQLRKIDLGLLKPEIKETDIILFIKDILIRFEQHASRRNINLRFDYPEEHIILRFDPELMTIVFYNLLANAIKYTDDGGLILVKVFLSERYKQQKFLYLLKNILRIKVKQPQWLAIEISDTGKGMPENEIKNIFKRFYQVNMPGTHSTGSGIGLSLVKEYVEIHNGYIDVKSELNKGSTFTVYLPADTVILSGKSEGQEFKLTEGSGLSEAQINSILTDDEAGQASEEDKQTAATNAGPHILIIEDDHELTDYLINYFSKSYRVTVAYNGEKGLNKAKEEMPDLIISDVMLPEKSGLQLCDVLKTSIETSHIPIILITARADEENIREGYQHGADLYITKPFNVKILDAQAKMLIDSRRCLRERYSRQILLKPADIAITPVDEKFLRQMIQIIEKHIADSEFDVNRLVSGMNMSHSTILRKVKALTGISLVEFIKNHRLKKAALILQKQKLPVSEVSYMVGFTDPKYFTKCFVKQFGITPSEYIAEYHANNVDEEKPE